MALTDNKITASEINSLNVKSAEDTYKNNNPRDNKDIFDRLPEHIAAKLNSLIDELAEVLAGMYTRTQVDEAISNKVLQMGAGDMAQAVYDTNHSGVVDKAEKLSKTVKIGNAYFNGSKGLTVEEMGCATAEQGQAAENLTTDVKFIKVVNELPSEPDVNTLYLVKK